MLSLSSYLRSIRKTRFMSFENSQSVMEERVCMFLKKHDRIKNRFFKNRTNESIILFLKEVHADYEELLEIFFFVSESVYKIQQYPEMLFNFDLKDYERMKEAHAFFVEHLNKVINRNVPKKNATKSKFKKITK